MVLIAKATGPRIIALAGRTWAVTHVDWGRQRAYVEPQQSGWDVTVDGRTTSVLVRAVERDAAGPARCNATELRAALRSRATEHQARLRDEFSGRVDGRTAGSRSGQLTARTRLRERAAGGATRWAHNGSFTDDDAYRVLDTAERLLTAIGAPDAADQVQGDPAEPASGDRGQGRQEGAAQRGRQPRVGRAGAVAGGAAAARGRRDRQLPGVGVRRGPVQGGSWRGRRPATTPTRCSSSPAPISPRACGT